MTYDLAALVKRQGIRRKAIRLRPIQITRTLEQELYGIALRPVRAWERQWQAEVAPVYARLWTNLTVDAPPDDLEVTLARAEAAVVAAMVGLSEEARDWLERVLRWHSSKWISAVKAGTGVDVFPYIDTNTSRDVLTAFRGRILNLIRDLEGQTRKNVSEIVWRGYLNRTPSREVGKEIAEAWGVSRRRAAFIAIDQANKLSSELTRIRQEEAGFGKYIWRSTGDGRVRPAHVSLNGRLMEWSKPHPTEGHPGYRPRCRCSAEAYLELE